MRFDIVTIFPGFFAGFFEHGIVRRAIREGLVTIETHDLRNFTHDKHRTVDDRPFGGGEGMVLKPEPLAEALEAVGIQPKLQRDRTALRPDCTPYAATLCSGPPGPITIGGWQPTWLDASFRPGISPAMLAAVTASSGESKGF